jgi:hypothetical protein
MVQKKTKAKVFIEKCEKYAQKSKTKAKEGIKREYNPPQDFNAFYWQSNQYK